MEKLDYPITTFDGVACCIIPANPCNRNNSCLCFIGDFFLYRFFLGFSRLCYF